LRDAARRLLDWGSGDRSGLLGLLLLTGGGLFLLYRSLSDSARKSYQLLSQQISRLEEQLKASQNEPMADQVASADRRVPEDEEEKTMNGDPKRKE
jgi:hypothetical protein